MDSLITNEELASIFKTIIDNNKILPDKIQFPGCFPDEFDEEINFDAFETPSFHSDIEQVKSRLQSAMDVLLKRIRRQLVKRKLANVTKYFDGTYNFQFEAGTGKCDIKDSTGKVVYTVSDKAFPEYITKKGVIFSKPTIQQSQQPNK